MAGIKQTARRATGGKAPRKFLGSKSCRRTPCYHYSLGKRHTPRSRNGRHSQRPKSHYQDTASSKIISSFKHPKEFPHFVRLPYEIQYKIWEMLAEEPRVVPINTRTDNGLYSSIPPILHVCSESRAVGLKHYTLAFKSQRFDDGWTDGSEPETNVLPPRVYFNFERDMLYFREKWNKKVNGEWCCLLQFPSLVDEYDLKRVRKVGLDVNARACSLEISGEECHPASFAHWDALEILCLGYEDVRLGSDCLITSSELESKDYEGFMQRYKINPCWAEMDQLEEDVEAADAVQYLRDEVPVICHGTWNKPKPDGFLRKLKLVSIKHL